MNKQQYEEIRVSQFNSSQNLQHLDKRYFENIKACTSLIETAAEHERVPYIELNQNNKLIADAAASVISKRIRLTEDKAAEMTWSTTKHEECCPVEEKEKSLRRLQRLNNDWEDDLAYHESCCDVVSFLPKPNPRHSESNRKNVH